MEDPKLSPTAADTADHGNFTFVLGPNQPGLRSRAMREHWKKRHAALKKQKTQKRASQTQRRLLPSTAAASASASTADDPAEGYGGSSNSSLTSSSGATGANSPKGEGSGSQSGSTAGSNGSKGEGEGGIPAQALCGMSLALACSRLDPFDVLPVKMEAQDQKLLHHWLSTHATMMFDDMSLGGFNPMRDVWVPLDLSNAASFNGVMAHSAAHLARMHGALVSKEALRYKLEAVRIVGQWTSDPDRALSDDTFAAVLRLLTYERYWGTEAEWLIHRQGLHRMLEARGGLQSLQSNWRLLLVVYLVSLMSTPSWFDSTNHIEDVYRTSFGSQAPQVMEDQEYLHRVRCLWLVSFIQDMRTVVNYHPERYSSTLRSHSAVQGAIALLQLDFQDTSRATSASDADALHDFERLACLFFISVPLHEAVTASTNPPTTTDPVHFESSNPQNVSELTVLDHFLVERQQQWRWAVPKLHSLLFADFREFTGQGSKTSEYVSTMTHVLWSMSKEARRGVESCLVHILCRDNASGQALMWDESWTPDFLLSSLHGT